MGSKDQKWIAQIKEGGQKAEASFRELTVHYGPKLYNQIFRIVRNEVLTKDVLQNVFIKVWKNLANFKEESNLYTWMYRIAQNESMTLLKKENKQPSQLSSSELIEVVGGKAEFDAMSSDEIYNLLLEAVGSLPEKQALVFELKYFEDLKFNEIKSLTGTSEGALKASFHLAKEKICNFIQSKLNH